MRLDGGLKGTDGLEWGVILASASIIISNYKMKSRLVIIECTDYISWQLFMPGCI